MNFTKFPTDSRKDHMRRYIEPKEKKKKFKRIIIGLSVGVLGFGATVGVLTAADNQPVAQTASTEDPDAITYKGVTYVPKGNLETYLFAGIDSSDKVEEITEYDGTGQCDVLLVLVRDRSTDNCKILTIDRNTMTPVRSLEDDGTYIATTDAQISLAHAMSLDHLTRAENTVDAVSTLLGGHSIDGYAMVNMGAIQIVNDMVGGVTVTVEEDFPDSDTLKKGATVTLQGADAERYIRERKTVADGLNQNRISRQTQYEEAFKPAFRAKCSENTTFPLDVYHAVEDYMTTNISAKKFSRLALLLTDEQAEERVSIDGTYDFDEDGWQTFTPDKDSLQEAILSLFYKEEK